MTTTVGNTYYQGPNPLGDKPGDAPDGVKDKTADAVEQKAKAAIEKLIETYRKNDGKTPLGGDGTAATPILIGAQEMSPSDVGILIGSLMNKVIGGGVKLSKSMIMANMKKQISANKEALQKFMDAIKKAAKAAKAGVLSKAFGWAGVALGALASAALIVGGILTANPALMIAGGFLMASTIVGATTMAVASTDAGKKFMKDNPWFATTMMVLQITLAVCSLGAGVYGAVTAATTASATTTASVTAETTAEVGSEAATEAATETATEAASETATEVAQESSQAMTKTEAFFNLLKSAPTKWQTYVALAQAGSQIGKGGTDIYVGVKEHDAAVDQADSDDATADAKMYQALIDDEIKRIQDLEKTLSGAMKIVMNMESHGHSTISKAIREMI